MPWPPWAPLPLRPRPGCPSPQLVTEMSCFRTGRQDCGAQVKSGSLGAASGDRPRAPHPRPPPPGQASKVNTQDSVGARGGANLVAGRACRGACAGDRTGGGTLAGSGLRGWALVGGAWVKPAPGWKGAWRGP